VKLGLRGRQDYKTVEDFEDDVTLECGGPAPLWYPILSKILNVESA
jgi:hypothetical protein